MNTVVTIIVLALLLLAAVVSIVFSCREYRHDKRIIIVEICHKVDEKLVYYQRGYSDRLTYRQIYKRIELDLVGKDWCKWGMIEIWHDQKGRTVQRSEAYCYKED